MKETTNHNKFLRIITIPIRGLAKARDFYVKSMNSYADSGCYGGGAHFGFSVVEPLPRSFSNRSADTGSDDLKDLIRVASSRAYAEKLDLAALNHHHHRYQKPPPLNAFSNAGSYVASKGLKGVPRSSSVGMAKIDEDKPCDFGDDEIKDDKDHKKIKKGGLLFPRSRSHADSTAPTTERF